MMKTHCLWYFRGYIKDHNHVRKLILSCKLFVFSSPLALFFSFSLLSVDLSFRTLASLCFLKYVVRFILCLQTTPLPFTNSASLWKACRKLSLASFFFILFAFFFFCPRLLFPKELLYLRSIHPHVNDRGFFSMQHSIPQNDHDLSRLSWPPDFKITLCRARTSSRVILASSTQVWNFYKKIKCFLCDLYSNILLYSQ